MKQLVTSQKVLGAAIMHQRKLQRLTQTQAGAPFRLDQSTISNIEKGVPGTRLDTLLRLLAALDLELFVCSKDEAGNQDNEEW